jgi:hypothetical protein
MRNLYVTMMRNNVCNNINNLVYVVLTNYTSKNSNFNYIIRLHHSNDKHISVVIITFYKNLVQIKS